MYVVADDDHLMKVNIQNSCTELMEKYQKFVRTRANGSKLKDVGNIDLDI